MRHKHLRIFIGTDGSVSVDAKNFTNAACQSATEEITRLLGGSVIREIHKPESRIAERVRDSERQPE